MNLQEIHPIIERILHSRNITSVEQIQEYFSWDLMRLPSFEMIMDMDKAVERILAAIDKKEKICIYGDYDVDGTTSCAVFCHFFRMIGIDVGLVQPGRFQEGYGLHVASVEKAKQDGYQLLITVDCGITNDLACARATELKLDIIITDHHADAAAIQPQAVAIINPNRRETAYCDKNPFKNLAGVGVAFAVCTQVRKKLHERGDNPPSLYPLLQFVSIGTICDCVPLNTINLTLARHGLKQMLASQYPGIRAFFHKDMENIKAQDKISGEQVGFTIGPMINSKGRLEHPEMALQMLTTQETALAYHYHFQLQNTNAERKTIQAHVFEQAKEQMQAKWNQSPRQIVYAYQADWHEGVIGIVASKLVELFKTPAIVLTNAHDGQLIKASARTANNIHLFDLLNECKEFFIKFGGHKAAAGFTIPKENLLPLENKLESLLKEKAKDYLKSNSELHYDISIRFNEIDVTLAKWLEALGPFGTNHPAPVFLLQGITLSSFTILKQAHLKWVFTHKDFPLLKHHGITFFYFQDFNRLDPNDLLDKQGQSGVDITFMLNINYFKGQRYLQLQVLTIQLNKNP